jgi:4-hydroxy-tetrahydrodipicolinate synthase
MRGLYPATVTPFAEDLSIDYPALERHLRETANVDGVEGLVVNAGLAELLQLTLDEQIKVLEVTKRVRRPGQLIVTGLEGQTVETLVDNALALKKAGAEAFLVFPPFDIRAYRRLLADPQSVASVFKVLDEKVDLPMIVFQYPPHSGSSYPLASLRELVKIPNVVAIKAASGQLPAYTEVWDNLKDAASILVAVDSPPLLDMLLHGSHGALIGISAIAPAKWVELLCLVENKHEAQARSLFEKVCMPIMESVFENQMPTRLTSEAAATKEALVQLGQLPSSRARLPAVNVSPDVAHEIKVSLINAGLIGAEEGTKVA